MIAKVTSCKPVSSLDSDQRTLLKVAADDDYVVTTDKSVFHPQGGGQPSDTGVMTLNGAKDAARRFEVKIALKGPNSSIFHLGRFSGQPDQQYPFGDGETILQVIDNAKRNYHSRLHTAGHVIGLAVRQLADTIPDVTELKANHAPGSAFVEFQGMIDGGHKDAIQAKATEILKQNLPVNICWWNEDEVKSRCTAVASVIPMPEEGTLRVVEILGFGAYPCGGTHLPNTSDIGEIVVRRIRRQKGVSKISYSITDTL